VPKKRGFLGMSVPLAIGVLLIFILLLISFIGGPIVGPLLKVSFLPSWLTVQPPTPELPSEAITHVGAFPITNTMITSWISMALLVILAWLGTRKMKLVPSGLQSLVEYAVGSLLNFCNSIAGEKYGRRFFPIVATIFLFVFVNAWTSLIPGYGSIVIREGAKSVPLLRAANTDINFPLALALISFVFVEYYGIRAFGVRYFEKFIRLRQLGQGISELFHGRFKSAVGKLLFGAIDVFIGILETISELLRNVSFTFRLFGNMTAGEILILIVTFLVPLVATTVIYGFEMFIGFIQAIIFSSLTLIFATMAVSSHEEEEGRGQEQA
jgi:F-type H+-transporting ATPase subunit a